MVIPLGSSVRAWREERVCDGAGEISIALLQPKNEGRDGMRESPNIWAFQGNNFGLHSCGKHLKNTSDTLIFPLNTPWGAEESSFNPTVFTGLSFARFLQALIIFMMPLRIWLDTDLVPGWNGAGLWSHQFFAWWVLTCALSSLTLGSAKPPLTSSLQGKAVAFRGQFAKRSWRLEHTSQRHHVLRCQLLTWQLSTLYCSCTNWSWLHLSGFF